MNFYPKFLELGFEPHEAATYCELFKKHAITENEVSSLDHQLLKEMGIEKIGHRIRILKLKSKEPTSCDLSLTETLHSPPSQNTNQQGITITAKATTRLIPFQHSENENKTGKKYIVTTDEISTVISSSSSDSEYDDSIEEYITSEVMEISDDEEESYVIENRDATSESNTCPTSFQIQSQSQPQSQSQSQSQSQPQSQLQIDYKTETSFQYLPSSTITSETVNLPVKRPKAYEVWNTDPSLTVHDIHRIVTEGQIEKLRDIIINSFSSVVPRKHQWETLYKIIVDLLLNPSTVDMRSLYEHHSNVPLSNISNYDPRNVEFTCQNVKNYLIQHSPGSGKSLTIACLVYLLYHLKQTNNSGNINLFDAIIVMNDRKQLDEQLGETVIEFLREHNITDVKRSNSSLNLSCLILERSARVIITTLQKFAKLLKPEFISKRRIAIIADEAHRTHGRRSTRRVHEFLTGSSRQSAQITYFSFTCTPSAKALEMFGVRVGHTYQPFYTYSMQQALEDGVIIDVLKDYTTVATIAKIQPSSEIEAKTKTYEQGIEATRQLLKATTEDQSVIKTKAQYILHHFLEKYKELSNELWKPKGMVVASSRRHIIWYKQELESLIQQLPEESRFDVVAAFTPFEMTKGRFISQEDVAVNRQYARNVIKSFKENPKVKMIIVADKLRTGFDEPQLGIMYIDKRLRGANVVQTLGRLNRIAPGKQRVCIVDFINTRTEISEAFSQYWGITTLVDAVGRGPLQTKLEVLAQRLLQIEGIKENNLTKAVEQIISEDFQRKQAGLRTIERELHAFTNICDRLQIEHPAIPYKFAVDLKQALFNEYKERISKAREILHDIHLHISGMKVLSQGCINVDKLKLKELKSVHETHTRIRSLDEPTPLSVQDIVTTANELYLTRIAQMNYNPVNVDISSALLEGEDYSADNLEFEKSIWKQKTNQKSKPMNENCKTDISFVKQVSLQQSSTISTSSASQHTSLKEIKKEPQQHSENVTSLDTVQSPSSPTLRTSLVSIKKEPSSSTITSTSSLITSSSTTTTNISSTESPSLRKSIELIPILFQQKTSLQKQQKQSLSQSQQLEQSQHQSQQSETSSVDDEKKRAERRERRKRKKEEKRRRRELMQKEQEELQRRAQQLLEELNKQQLVSSQSQTQPQLQQHSQSQPQSQQVNTNDAASSLRHEKTTRNEKDNKSDISSTPEKTKTKESKEKSEVGLSFSSSDIKQRTKNEKKGSNHHDSKLSQSSEEQNDRKQLKTKRKGKHEKQSIQKEHEPQGFEKSHKKRKHSESKEEGADDFTKEKKKSKKLVISTSDSHSTNSQSTNSQDQIHQLQSQFQPQIQSQLQSHLQIQPLSSAQQPQPQLQTTESFDSSTQSDVYLSTQSTISSKEDLKKILQILDSTASAKQRKKALRALRNHAVTEENKNILRELGAIPLLIKIVQIPTFNSEEKELAIATLGQLASNNQNSELIRISGGISALMTLLNERNYLPLLETTVRTLGLLSHNESNAREIISMNGVIALVRLLEPSLTIEIQTEAVNLLTTLIYQDARTVTLIMNSDGLAKLTQMLNSTTPNALSAALKALIAIAKTNEDTKSLIKSIWNIRKQLFQLMYKGHSELKTCASELIGLLYPETSKYHYTRPMGPKRAQTSLLSKSWVGPQHVHSESERSSRPSKANFLHSTTTQIPVSLSTTTTISNNQNSFTSVSNSEPKRN